MLEFHREALSSQIFEAVLWIVKSSITMTYMNVDWQFWFPNIDDSNEDAIPLGREGITEEAENYYDLLKDGWTVVISKL